MTVGSLPRGLTSHIMSTPKDSWDPGGWARSSCPARAFSWASVKLKSSGHFFRSREEGFEWPENQKSHTTRECPQGVWMHIPCAFSREKGLSSQLLSPYLGFWTKSWRFPSIECNVSPEECGVDSTITFIFKFTFNFKNVTWVFRWVLFFLRVEWLCDVGLKAQSVFSFLTTGKLWGTLPLGRVALDVKSPTIPPDTFTPVIHMLPRIQLSPRGFTRRYHTAS